MCHVDEYGNRVHFETISQYVDWLFSEFQGQLVWAHAGGRYDHRFLIPEFYKRGWSLNAALSGGSIVVLTVTDLIGRVMSFGDSFRLMPNALKDIGTTVNLEKMDVDRNNLGNVPFETVLEYCFRDCEIALRGLQYMRDVLTSVNADFAYTLASIATRWVRRSPAVDFNRFYRPDPTRKGKIRYDPDMEFADYWCEGRDRPPTPEHKLVYSAYHGGHTEMFHDSMKDGIIKGPVYYYDIVSSYPYSMTKPLPLYFLGWFTPPTNPTRAQTEQFLSHSGITEAWVNVPPCVTGPLALQRDGAPLIFPQGAIQGRFTNVELLAALHRGADIRLGIQCRFEEKAFLRPFVETFYGLRKKAKADKDAFRSYAFKILLNSLYGKLVETVTRTSYTTDGEKIKNLRDQAAAGESVILSPTKIAGLWAVENEETGPFRHVAAGAYVTAYSRLRLLEGIEEVLRQGGKVYYCDTDSIMSSIPLPHMEGKELGDWQAEYVLENVEILLPKVYKATIQKTGKTMYRCKGLPIEREKEPPEIPEKRWEAFKTYQAIKAAGRHHQLTAEQLIRLFDKGTGQPAANDFEELSHLLAKDGITGFVADIGAGRLSPQRAPLLRALQSTDKKRDWTVSPSQPLSLDYAASFETDEPMRPRKLRYLRKG